MERTTNTAESCIDIPNEDNLLANRLAKEISCMPSVPCCIFKVPRKLRNVSQDTYTPRVISIGPYHHGKENLEANEKYKQCYLQSFIARAAPTSSPNACLADFVKSIREIEVYARECYSEPIDVTSDEFVRMMILDGCFIIELLIKYQEEESDMDSKDCLFKATWILPSLRRDLVLLENQIPFIVLDRLFNLVMSPAPAQSLNDLIFDFFDPILPTVLENKPDHSIHGKHLLDVLRIYLLYPYEAIDLGDSPISGKYTGSGIHESKVMYFGDSPIWEYTTCATDLQEAGVTFKRKDDGHGLLDITFTRDGKFEIPPFVFGESWTVLLPNMIALEQCRRDYPDKITSYVILVNKLFNSASDVKLFRDEGIVISLSKRDEKVASIIDNLCEEVVVDKFYYDGLCNRVNTYRKSSWRGVLKRGYFRNPSAAFVLVVVVIFLIMVVLTSRTVYIRSY